mgnify:FL=1
MNKEKFKEKYDLYSQELMNISYGYTKSKEDSLDIIQNVFYKLFVNDKVFESNDDEKYYLIRLTINECKDLIRKKSKIVSLNNNLINNIPLVNDSKNEDLRLEKLSLKVKELNNKYRIVIILFYYDSLPIKEISKILNLSVNTIKKRLERARNILKKEMEEE